MNGQRILVLKSIVDSEFGPIEEAGLRKRLLKMGIESRFFYPLTALGIDRSHQGAIDYRKLIDLLDKEVIDFQPNLIAVHTGLAFSDNPVSFIQALAVLKDRHPELSLRYETVYDVHSDWFYGMNGLEPKEIFANPRVQQALLSYVITDNPLFDGPDTEVWRHDSR